MILPPSLFAAAFCGAALAMWWGVGDAVWTALTVASAQLWTGSRPAWGSLALLAAPALAGAVAVWLVATANQALTRRLQVRDGAGGSLSRTDDRWGAAWMVLGTLPVLALVGAAGQWAAAGAARPGAVLSGWATWGWWVALATCLGLLLAGVGEAVARHGAARDASAHSTR